MPFALERNTSGIADYRLQPVSQSVAIKQNERRSILRCSQLWILAKHDDTHAFLLLVQRTRSTRGLANSRCAVNQGE